MTTKSGKSVDLEVVTMIDLSTGWIEIRIVTSARADLVASQEQDNEPIAFYNRKLNPAQVNYTTIEREL